MKQAKLGKEYISKLGGYKKYGTIQAGEVLASFISNIDTTESLIGEYRKDHDGYLVVSGLQINEIGKPVDILSDLNTTIEVFRFNSFNGEPAIKILKEYLNSIDNSQVDYKTAVMNKFKAISSNKNVVVPFKPQDQCEITVEDVSKHFKTGTATIETIKWGVNKQDSKFKSEIVAKADNPSIFSKTYHKIDISEYGTKFKINAIESGMKHSDIDRNSVKMTPMGIINPLIVKDDTITIALDCKNLYMVINDEPIIISEWTSYGKIKTTDITTAIEQSKAYKYLMYNIEYIEKHRRFIGPYMIVNGNTIDLRGYETLTV